MKRTSRNVKLGVLRVNLMEERKKANFTQREVGKLSGISESYYSMIESGDRKPTVKTAKKIAAALGFDWTLFFEDEKKNPA